MDYEILWSSCSFRLNPLINGFGSDRFPTSVWAAGPSLAHWRTTEPDGQPMTWRYIQWEATIFGELYIMFVFRLLMVLLFHLSPDSISAVRRLCSNHGTQLSMSTTDLVDDYADQWACWWSNRNFQAHQIRDAFGVWQLVVPSIHWSTITYALGQLIWTTSSNRTNCSAEDFLRATCMIPT